MAQYFPDTFKKHPISWNYLSLPSMYLYFVMFQTLNGLIGIEFDASGAFVGTLTKDVEPASSADGEIDNWSLIHSTFLARLAMVWFSSGLSTFWLNLNLYFRVQSRGLANPKPKPPKPGLKVQIWVQTGFA